MNRYKYFTFGLRIISDIELPQLLELEGDVSEPFDVEIKLGETPKELANPKNIGVTFQANENEFYLDLLNIGSYYVTNGHSIIVQKNPECDEKGLRVFLLGSCLGVILHQRMTFPLHASAIEHNGKAILFTATSGVGKSSTANSFRLKGYKMLTDDVCPVEFRNDVPFALPGYPQSKLWLDTVEHFGFDKKSLGAVRKGINKKVVNIKDEFCTEALPIGAIYRLFPADVQEVKIVEVENAKRFQLINNMTYRGYLIKNLSLQKSHFRNAIRLSNSVPIKRVIRPNFFCLDEVVEAVEADLLNQIYV